MKKLDERQPGANNVIVFRLEQSRRADDISEKIERLTQRGIHQVSLRVLAADCDTTIAQIERLAREVLPNFR